MPNPILIEGFTPEEILALPSEHIEQLVLTGEPLVFRAGSAQILGEFRVTGQHLIIELAQIDGGGEGVLPTIGALAERYARSQNLEAIEWIVHAINCANPNEKLRRTLERRGFEIREVPEYGEAFYQMKKLS